MKRLFHTRAAILFAAFLMVFLAQLAMAAPVPPVMRLGEAVKPLAYDAELTIVPDAETFEGRMAIDIDIAQSRDFFWINATGLDIRHAVLVAGERSLPAEIVPGNADFVGF